MKVLVLTAEPIAAAQLRDALGGDVEPRRSEVMVVAPALQENPLKFWLSDADEAIANADRVRRETLARLGADGVPASADTGDSDPLEAIQDALQSFAADRIVVFTRSGEDQRYREDIDEREIEERFGIPVDHALLPA